MKGYKRFVILFVILLAIYIVAEMNRPKETNWKVTLSATDKNPYGSYILHQQLQSIFPVAEISVFQMPLYDQLNQFKGSNTAYMCIGPDLRLSAEDRDALLQYVGKGNFAFLASGNFSRQLLDTLKFSTQRRFDLLVKDSITINFKNPSVHTEKNYGFQRMTLDGYLNRFDTAGSLVLGNNQLDDVNYIKIPYGDGAFFIHAIPLCFSNYFMLTSSNASYTSKALSYIPKGIHTLYWDEYYKPDNRGAGNPLAFILQNPWLRSAFRMGLLTMALFILFEIKRKQPVIPVIIPLGNSTLDFVKTVGNVYFNQRDNKNLAAKKISYFLEHIRSVFFLPTSQLNDEFVEALAKKTAVQEQQVAGLVGLIQSIQQSEKVSDYELLELNRQIEEFYAGSEN